MMTHTSGQPTLSESSSSIKARVEQEMQRFLGQSALNLPQKVALGCRILANEGQPMDMMMFHEACAHLREWPGVPLANEEGELISRALGQKSAIVLAWARQVIRQDAAVLS
jgi:hypothetical protein